MSTNNESERKSAKRFWWIIMLLPIGLGVGTVTSLVQHLRKANADERQDEFTISSAIDASELEQSYERAQLIGARSIESPAAIRNIQTLKNFIQGSVSPGGVGLKFTDILTPAEGYRSIKTSYADVLGRNPNFVTNVVIELAGEKSAAEAAKLAIATNVISSLASIECQQTLRFILSPMSTSATEHAALAETIKAKRNEASTTTVVIKTTPSIELNYTNGWFDTMAPTEMLQVNTSVTEAQAITISHPSLSLTYQNRHQALENAANELRELLIQLANRR